MHIVCCIMRKCCGTDNSYVNYMRLWRCCGLRFATCGKHDDDERRINAQSTGRTNNRHLPQPRIRVYIYIYICLQCGYFRFCVASIVQLEEDR